MLDSIRLKCPACDHVFHQSVAYVTGQIKAMKIEKRDQAAQQMADKCGPFYNKWLKAMKARGDQKRCGDCNSFEWELEPDSGCERRPELGKVNSGQFACSFFKNYLEV